MLEADVLCKKVNSAVPVLEQVLCLLKREDNVRTNCAHEFTYEHMCVHAFVCVILAEPEGGGAPALCHSVASAASFRT